MAEQKPIISIDHVSMRFNLSKEKHESLKEYFVALLHGGVRFDEFFAAHGLVACVAGRHGDKADNAAL